ncbi:MAG: Gfo/Idh/MocA family oxidoreductase [Geobacteraceae bacterium]|nr:Gfo/Idh/MocA family oxidoreductase [Geobacteraceae bacterium]NTW79530.1 Gfo/Idh/MocA family oxidoreductase [Geobacteraceae bacterium]
MKVWLIGAGSMAQDYSKVLCSLESDITVIGRGEKSALQFYEATGLPVVAGGLEVFLAQSPTLPNVAIVSVGVEALSSTCIQLIKAGVKKILVEKPAALDTPGLHELNRVAVEACAEVFVAYNRRFYAATLHAKRMIEEDGGLLSCNFEFTEWGHEIEGLIKAPGVKDNWFLGNSTHVVDLAFYLAGVPQQLSCYKAGSLPWHSTASIFAGAGVTDKGVLFSYQANWGAPGRWGVEVLTANYRLIFRPMESLQIMRKGSVKIELVEIDDSLDKAFKPGLYEQVSRFIDGHTEGFCTLAEQVEHWDYYCRIAGYTLSDDLAGRVLCK